MVLSKVSVLNKVEGEFEIKEYPVPDPKPSEMVVKVELTAVCGTDVHMYYGHLDGMPYPLHMGHEIAGIIYKLGTEVKEDLLGRKVKEGDRVVIIPGQACGNCYYCSIAKSPTRCSNVTAYGFAGDTEESRLTGGYGQFLHVKNPNSKFIKTELPAEIAVLTESLSIGMHGIARAGGLPFGSTVVVQGTGAVGIGAIIFAKLAGAIKIIAVGGPKSRLELVKELGADVTIDIADVPSPEERLKIIKNETLGRGADVVIEAAGFPSTIPEGLDYLRDSGKFIELGHFTNAGNVPINPHFHFMQKHVELYGVWGSETEFIAKTLLYLEKREMPYEKIVSHTLPLTGLQDAIDALSKKGWKLGDQEVSKIVIDPWM